MLKVKIFVHNNLGELENQINNFLQDLGGKRGNIQIVGSNIIFVNNNYIFYIIYRA